MKPVTLEKTYALILLIIFGGIVVHAPISVYLGTVVPASDLLIKSWKEILMLASLPLAVAVVVRRRLWRTLLYDHIVQLAAAYTLVHVLIASAILRGPLATLAGLAIDLRYIVFFILVYVLMKAAPQYRRRFLQVGAAGAAVIVGFAVLQLFLPPDILTHIGYSEHTIQPYLTVDENPQFIRINSTLRGPNPLGAYAVIVISLIAAVFAGGWVKPAKSRPAALVGLLTLGCMAALWFSYSRSAVAAAFVTVGVVAAVSARRRLSRRCWIAGAIIICALAGGLFAGRDSAFVSNVLLHENQTGGSTVSSNDGHAASLDDGIRRLLRQPVGGGVGSTGSASLLSADPLVIENQYLFIAHEAGWLGLGLFAALYASILVRLWQKRRDWLGMGMLASGLGLAVIGLVLPVWVDDTVAIVWWGLAGIVIGRGVGHGKQSGKQKTA